MTENPDMGHPANYEYAGSAKLIDVEDMQVVSA